MNGKIVHGFVLMTIVFVAFITLSWAEPISWENLTVDQIEALRTVQSIRIVVKCFGDLDQCEKLKINELIESKLQAAGVSVAKADDPNFQTSITVELNATALGSSYIGRGQASQYHYSGASVSGQIVVAIYGQPKGIKTFRGQIKPPDNIFKEYKMVSDAPFAEAFSDSDFHELLNSLFAKVYGPKCIIRNVWIAKNWYDPVSLKTLEDMKDTIELPLMQAIRDDDVALRRGAIEALSWSKELRTLLDEDQLVNKLISALLEDTDAEVRKGSANVLLLVGKTTAVPALVKAMDDSDSDVRASAASALGSMPDPHSVEPLTKALNDSNPRVRRISAMALGEIGSAEAVIPLVSMLAEDEDGWSRANAAESLGKIRDVKAEPALIAALSDKDYDVRWKAAGALGEIGDQRAIIPLLESMNDPVWNVRDEVLIALSKLGDSRAILPIIDMLDDDSSFVRDSAVEALKKLTGQEYQTKEEWENWWNKQKPSDQSR